MILEERHLDTSVLGAHFDERVVQTQQATRMFLLQR